MKFKKYSHSRVYGKRVNWRSLTIAFTLAGCFFVSNYANKDNSYVADKTEDVFMKPVVVVLPPSIEDKIRSYFPKNWKIMIAVAHAESQPDNNPLSEETMNAKGYNCYYSHGIATTTPIKGGSRACEVKDRALAYSVDCFLLQKNYKGQKCPTGVSLDQHLKEVSELSKVQGLGAWSSFNNKSYLAHLNK